MVKLMVFAVGSGSAAVYSEPAILIDKRMVQKTDSN